MFVSRKDWAWQHDSHVHQCQFQLGKCFFGQGSSQRLHGAGGSMMFLLVPSINFSLFSEKLRMFTAWRPDHFVNSFKVMPFHFVSWLSSKVWWHFALLLWLGFSGVMDRDLRFVGFPTRWRPGIGHLLLLGVGTMPRKEISTCLQMTKMCFCIKSVSHGDVIVGGHFANKTEETAVCL